LCAQLCKKLLALGCCFVCVAVIVMMIPQVLGGVMTSFLTGGGGE